MNRIRKLYYKLIITFVWVVVGVVVGGIELVGLGKDKLNLEAGWFWSTIGILQDNFGAIGLVIVGVFILTWLVSAIVYRVKKVTEGWSDGCSALTLASARSRSLLKPGTLFHQFS